MVGLYVLSTIMNLRQLICHINIDYHTGLGFSISVRTCKVTVGLSFHFGQGRTTYGLLEPRLLPTSSCSEWINVFSSAFYLQKNSNQRMQSVKDNNLLFNTRNLRQWFLSVGCTHMYETRCVNRIKKQHLQITYM